MCHHHGLLRIDFHIIFTSFVVASDSFPEIRDDARPPTENLEKIGPNYQQQRGFKFNALFMCDRDLAILTCISPVAGLSKLVENHEASYFAPDLFQLLFGWPCSVA